MERSDGGERPAKRLRTGDTNGHIWVGLNLMYVTFFFIFCSLSG